MTLSPRHGLVAPSNVRNRAWICLTLLAFAACSSEGGGTGGTGGTPASGGSTGIGNAGSGGATPHGGALGNGGAANGGSSTNGGAANGGSSTNGGAANGGSSTNGGAANGGSSTNGGSSATGGAPARGGASNSGGSAGASAGSAGQAGANGGGLGSGGSGGYNPCPTTPNTPCAVLPLGDSITEGYASSGGGYRVELFRQATQNGKNLTFVGSQQNGPTSVESRTFPRRHEGRGGYTIDTDSGHSGISGQITDQAIANYHPNIVLLMIGTNDINGNVDIANAPTRLGKLIDEITTGAPSALVVVATIVPVADANTNQRVQTYNKAIPAQISSRASAGKHVVLLDNYAAFIKDANYKTALMADNLHPNDAGYAVLGRAFYGAVSTVLPAL
jgi:lysophospholipase L1-like esterase